jgi:hypothetical protein
MTGFHLVFAATRAVEEAAAGCPFPGMLFLGTEELDQLGVPVNNAATAWAKEYIKKVPQKKAKKRSSK